MTTRHGPDTNQLIERARGGDTLAAEQLLGRYRERLTHMVAVRMDQRLCSRIDASDVVQETLWVAARNMETYLREQPLPFYPWLRQRIGVNS